MRSDYKTVPPRERIDLDPETGDRYEEAEELSYTDPAVISKFVNGDVFVWFMQTITLVMLCIGLSEVIPPQLTALFCILITAATMITMNARSFKGELKKKTPSLNRGF